jgi:undecaprenyl-diphosphatase
VLAAIIWGLVQGLTEFLPISSSGHLVIVPAFLETLGMDIDTPSLAVSAVLHLGTLLAVLVYFRADIAKVLRLARDPEGRRIALLVGIGTIPAIAGLPLEGTVENLQESVTAVGVALIVTGVVLTVGQLLATGSRNLLEGRIPDAIVVGVAQAIALVPGISRSGMTISAGNGRRFEPTQAARFSFLLGIPAIAAAGALKLFEAFGSGEKIGMDTIACAGLTFLAGLAAIAFLMAMLRRVSLLPFVLYRMALGGFLLVLLYS